MVVLCSPESIARPWINFEAGAAWVKGIPLIPACHQGLAPRQLPVPLSLRQGVSLSEVDGVSRLYDRLAVTLRCRVPQRDFASLARRFRSSLEEVPPIDPNAALRARLIEALNHPELRFRSLKALASEGGTSEERVADILLADPNVRFAKNKNGGVIVGLKERVGTRRIKKTSE